jgi:hypothetical protein
VSPDALSPAASEAPLLSASEPVHVALEVKITNGTISGQLGVDGAPTASFHGWLELIDRIERAINHQPQPNNDTALRDESTYEP